MCTAMVKNELIGAVWWSTNKNTSFQPLVQNCRKFIWWQSGFRNSCYAQERLVVRVLSTKSISGVCSALRQSPGTQQPGMVKISALTHNTYRAQLHRAAVDLFKIQMSKSTRGSDHKARHNTPGGRKSSSLGILSTARRAKRRSISIPMNSILIAGTNVSSTA